MAEPLYRGIVWSFKGIFRGLGLRISVVGEENIPAVGGAIIAINHTSYLDFALAGIPADLRGRRFVRFMAKESIFRHPVAGPLMRGMRHIPVDRSSGTAAFRDAVAAAKGGELIGVFPEATMSRSFEIKEIKNGAVRIARAAQVPLIPMIVFGGHRVLSYGVQNLSRGTPVLIEVGEPLPIAPGQDPDGLNAELHGRLSALLDSVIDRYPGKVPGAPWLPARWGGGAPTLEQAREIEERRRRERDEQR